MSEQLDRDQTTPQGADNDDSLGSGDPSRKRQRVQDDDDDSDSKPGQSIHNYSGLGKRKTTSKLTTLYRSREAQD